MTTIQPMPTKNPWKNEAIMPGFGRWESDEWRDAKGRYDTIKFMLNDPQSYHLITLDEIMFTLVFQYHLLGVSKSDKARFAAEYAAVQQPGAQINPYIEVRSLHYDVVVPEAEAPAYKPGDVVNGHVLAVVDGAYQWIPVAV